MRGVDINLMSTLLQTQSCIDDEAFSTAWVPSQ